MEAVHFRMIIQLYGNVYYNIIAHCVIYCRELAGGVDTLKNIAEVLQFIDNICEIKDKSS